MGRLPGCRGPLASFPQLFSQLRCLLLGILAGLLVLLSVQPDSTAQSSQPAPPPSQSYPLPPSLAQWQVTDAGDYFDAVTPTELGYLIWSEFPVSVYIQPETSAAGSPTVQPDAWREAVEQAIQEWTPYLPLTITADSTSADITILRTAPPMQRPDATGPPRIRSAETRYEFFVRQQSQPQPQASFFQRLTIYLSPNQTVGYTLATARHELGHALGIWGHSPNPADALYFSQVRHPASISQRDINTLKRIYQQPTQLGWATSAAATGSETQNLDQTR
jgi:predicted Zn-dependent protease